MRYKIVTGIDGSDDSDAALRWALAAAEAQDGEVIAVFAWQMPFVSNPAAFDRAELEQDAKDFLVNQVSKVAPAPRVPLTSLVAEGDPAESLVMASRDADLLVIGARGRSTFLGVVLGGVSLRCAVAARCPVTLVKVADEK
jgi:nucleotide-binding universal stress UspA family protein